MRSLRLRFVICALAMFIASNASASNFADTYGFSAKGMSMGNAMTAIVNDWSSVWYNIAGLGKTAQFKGEDESSGGGAGAMTLLKKRPDDDKKVGFHPNEVAISYFYSYPVTQVDGVGSSKEKEATDLDMGIIVLGLTLDVNSMIKLPKKVISSCRFGLGMGTGHDGSLVKVNDIHPATPNYLRYGREASKAMILAGLGMGFLNDGFGFGIGVNLSFKGNGKVNLNDVIVSPDPQDPKREVKMDLKVAPAVICGLYISPGQFAKVIKGLEFGASYRMENQMEVSPFSADASLLAAGIQLPMGLAIIDYYSPHIVTGGVAYTILDLVTISIDFDYQFWSQFEFDPQNGLSNLPGLQDVWTIRTGVYYQALKIFAVSVGYYYQPTMVPDNLANGYANVLDNDKHVASIGFHFDIPQIKFTGGPLFINIAYQMQYLVPRKVTKTTDAYDVDYNPNYEYGGTVHTAMLSLGMKI